MKFVPEAFDLIAHYEPRADFAVTRQVRQGLADLARKYRRATFMMGKHTGKPKLHTDIKGISVGTRLEISRLVLRPSAQVRLIAEALNLFIEAAEHRVSSGPIQRIIFDYSKCTKRPEPRAAAREAFHQVFGSDCRFLTSHYKHLEIGRAVDHQSLLQHLREDGPYHSDYQPRVEAVVNELQKQAGRYENHQFFTEPLASEHGMPDLRFCYTGDAPDRIVETALRQKTGVELVFVDSATLADAGDRYVSLSDYERAARRFGKLWVMQDDLIRPLDRQHEGVLFLFFDEHRDPEYGRAFTWQELYDRLTVCSHVSRASRQSPTFLDMSLHELTQSNFLTKKKDRWSLSPSFADYRHVTFYELGSYSRRLSG